MFSSVTLMHFSEADRFELLFVVVGTSGSFVERRSELGIHMILLSEKLSLYWELAGTDSVIINGSKSDKYCSGRKKILQTFH